MKHYKVIGLFRTPELNEEQLNLVAVDGYKIVATVSGNGVSNSIMIMEKDIPDPVPPPLPPLYHPAVPPAEAPAVRITSSKRRGNKRG